MAALKNQKHELFAHAVVNGMSTDEAYAAAGFKESRQNAFRLRNRPDVEARIKELQETVAEKAEWSAAERLSTLKGIVDRTKDEDPRTAISAICEANKMQGSHAPVKQEVTGKGGGAIETITRIERAIVDGSD